jgi:hypothetical protein
MNIRLTPQQKKKLSYKKDRRNTYGERGAHSRHAIRDSKDIVERKRRHSENQILRGILVAKDEEQTIALENTFKSLSVSKEKFYKMADTPLGEVIKDKLAYREFKGMGAKRKKPTQGKTAFPNRSFGMSGRVTEKQE